MGRSSRWCLLAVLVALPVPAARGQAKPEKRFTHREIRAPKGFVNHVVFSRDGSLMAAGSGANVVVWNVADGKEVQRMQLPEKQVYQSLVFAADGKTLIWNGGADPMFRVFDVKTGKQVREFRQPYGRNRRAFNSHFAAYSPDGKYIACFAADYFKGLDVYDIAREKVAFQFDVEHCRGCVFSDDGKLLATHTSSGGVHVWELSTGRLVKELHANGSSPAAAYCFVAFSPDAKFLATCGHLDKAIHVWSLKTGKAVCTLTDSAFFRTAFFAPDNHSLLCVPAATGRAYLYNLLAEKAIYHFDPPHRLAHFAAFSPDARRVVVLGPSSEGGDSSIYGQHSLYVYDVPAEALNPAAAQVDDAALEKLWPELGGDNELRRQRVLKALRAAPLPTVALLRKKVQPVAAALQRQVEQQITALEDDASAKRDQAMKELQGVAHPFAPLLKAKLAQAPAGETRNRLTFVLKQMSEAKPPQPLVMELRALALLEEIGTPEARELLERIAGGAPQARLTVEAWTVLRRWSKAKASAK